MVYRLKLSFRALHGRPCFHPEKNPPAEPHCNILYDAYYAESTQVRSISAPRGQAPHRVTCLSRLTLGSVGPGCVLSPAAFVRPVHIIAPETSALHLFHTGEDTTQCEHVGQESLSTHTLPGVEVVLQRDFFSYLHHSKVFQSITT